MLKYFDVYLKCKLLLRLEKQTSAIIEVHILTWLHQNTVPEGTWLQNTQVDGYKIT